MRITSALTTICNALILQLAFLLFAIPLVTVAPAAVALQRQLSDLRDGQPTGFVSFVREFRRTWRQTCGLGVLVPVITVGFLAGIPFWYSVHGWFGLLGLALLIFLLGMTSAFYLNLLDVSDRSRGTSWRTWLGPPFGQLDPPAVQLGSDGAVSDLARADGRPAGAGGGRRGAGTGGHRPPHARCRATGRREPDVLSPGRRGRDAGPPLSTGWAGVAVRQVTDRRSAAGSVRQADSPHEGDTLRRAVADRIPCSAVRSRRTPPPEHATPPRRPPPPTLRARTPPGVRMPPLRPAASPPARPAAAPRPRSIGTLLPRNPDRARAALARGGWTTRHRHCSGAVPGPNPSRPGAPISPAGQHPRETP